MDDGVVAGLVNKVIEQVTGVFGKKCWGTLDATGAAPIDLARRCAHKPLYSDRILIGSFENPFTGALLFLSR